MADEGRGRAIKMGLQTVETTSPGRVLFPESGLTKGDLIEYYRRIAPRMLPCVTGRPVVMNRYPGGIGQEGFIQQRAPDHYPAWITRAAVDAAEGTVTHAVIDEAATLVYLANQSVITPHVWLSRGDQPHHPDRLIFDLDPSGAPFDAVRETARAVHRLLGELGLPAFLMTTGSTGLHVVTPLERRHTFDAVRRFARDVADVLVGRHPGLVTTEQRKEKRGGGVFLDTLRNTYGHTAVAPYAVRALPGAPVATPLGWDELGRTDLEPQRYTLQNLFRRLARKTDPWAGLGRGGAPLGEPRRRLDRLVEAG